MRRICKISVFILSVCIVIAFVVTSDKHTMYAPSTGTEIILSTQPRIEEFKTEEPKAAEPEFEEPEPFTLDRIHTISFADVKQKASYYDAVCYVTYTGLMKSVSPKRYEPTAFASRGALAYALYRLSSAGDNEGPSLLSARSVQRRAVIWARTNGIMEVITGSDFLPERAVTREEIAATLFAYAKYAGYPIMYDTCISAYSDAAEVDVSTYDAVDWAIAAGIFKPLVASLILPHAAVTKAQLSKVLVSFIAHTAGEKVAESIADRLPPALSLPASEENETIQTVINGIAECYAAVGVQVAVIRDGIVTDTYAYGSATKNVQAMTAQTRMRVASISKVVLGMAAMTLQEDGIIDIDADLSDYWGAAIRNPHCKDIPITIRSILSHTSSIAIYGDGVSTSGSSIRSKLTSSACFSSVKPGTIDSWGYNNYAFAALGVTLETAAGETINSIMNRKLFHLLDIDASYGSGNVNTSRLATLYHHDGSVACSVGYQKANRGSTYPGQTGAYFAGGLTISAYDLAKLVAVLANDGVYDDQRLLSAESVACMETISEQKVPDALFYQGLPLRYQTDIYGQDALFYHTGSSYGVYNCMSYNPATGAGVVVLTTGASDETDRYGIYKICGEISEYIYNDSASCAHRCLPPFEILDKTLTALK